MRSARSGIGSSRAGGVAVWDWDLLTDRILWGEAAAGTCSATTVQCFSTSAAWWYERLHGEDRERVLSGMHEAIARGAAEWTDEYRFRRRTAATRR